MLFQKTELRFRKYLELENKKSKCLNGATESEDFPEKVFAYLSVALDVPVKRLENTGWDELIQFLLKSASHSPLNKELPILKEAPKDQKSVDWDWDGRVWAYYSHMLAEAYGWTLEYIANLDVNEAFAHIQEILTSEFLEREYAYGLSEVAYPYNKNTKKSEYKEMKRPYWMKPSAPKEIKRFKMRRDSLPMGRIVDISGLPEQYAIQGLEVEKPK